MRTMLAAAAVLVATVGPVFAEPAAKVAIHVDEQDASTMNMALNNAANIASYYSERGEEVAIEIVTYGPGLHMLRADTSPVADRISAMDLELPNVTFAACANTLAGMEKKAQGEVPLLEEATIVPSGAVRLMELQQQGYSYLRP